MQYLLNKSLLNLILLITIIATSLFIISFRKKSKKISRLLYINKNKKKKHKKENKLFSKLKGNLYLVLLLKNKESHYELIFNLYLLTLFAIFLFLLTIHHLALAIVIPALIYFFTIKILEEMIIDFDAILRKNFSILANHMVKIFSRTNDLGIVLYESSKEVEEPLRTLILNLSREVIIDNSERKLISFIEETDNLWLHSFIFTLINYKETSSKEDIIDNLLTLADLIEKRNEMSEKMIADRKPVVIVNYMILVIGIVIFIGNLILNPIMKSFIFTPFGTFSLITGTICMFLTVIINMKFSKY